MTDNADQNFVGRGFSFPMRVDPSGNIALAEGHDELVGSMKMVLSTAPGERVMRPTFGCRIWELVFAPVNANTIGLMNLAVREALGQWEPRIDVEDVRSVPDPDDPSRVLIAIDYRERATNDRRNLVYPFYVIPKEGEA